MKLPTVVGECAVGHTAAMGALAAVLRARATGAGAFVDCAATEALATNPTKMSLHLGWEYRGRELSAQVMPERSATVLPLGVLPCADGNVAMMMTPQQLAEMLEVLDDDELRAFFARPDAFVRPEARRSSTGCSTRGCWGARGRRSPTRRAGRGLAGHTVTSRRDAHAIISTSGGSGFTRSIPRTDRSCSPGAPYRLTEGGWKLRRVAPRLGAVGFAHRVRGRPAGACPPAAATPVGRAAPRAACVSWT